MGIVQGAGNGGNDRRSLRCRHPGRETLAHQVRSRQRAAVASALRADHRSWREVARALGYRSVGAGEAAVKAHLDREYRQPHEQTVWEQIEAVKLRQRVLGDQLATATLEGDVDRVVMLNKELARNGDQLAKLTGTYAPDRRQVDVAVDTAPSAATAEWLRQVAAAAAAVSGGGRPAALASAAEVIDAEVVNKEKLAHASRSRTRHHATAGRTSRQRRR
jgi:hypothetical protein